MSVILLVVASSLVAVALAEGLVRGLDLFARERTVLLELDDRMDSEGAAEGDAAEGEEAPRAKKALSEFQIHPYRGWALRPGTQSRQLGRANVFGFYSDHDDYRQVTDDHFVVGIFGGSVANDLDRWGGEVLRQTLVDRGVATPETLRVLNFGGGAYKQPQQLLTLGEMATHGIPFDVVVNVDGFNEVAIGTGNASLGRHPILPSHGIFTSILDASTDIPSREQLLAMAEIERLKEHRASLRERALRGWGRLAIVRSILGIQSAEAQRQTTDLELQLRTLSGQRVESALVELHSPCLGKPGGCRALVVDQWVRASVAMKHLAEGLGAHYVQFLQPNQYFEGSKVLTREEQDLFFGRKHPWRVGVEKGYPLLLARVGDLEAEGVAFHDLTDLFAEEKGTIYRDSCCHYNERGNALLARRVGEVVADTVFASTVSANTVRANTVSR